MTPEMVIYRGLPASGKTTRARAWVAKDPANRARVNRDDLRAMLHDGVYLGHDTEKRVRVARDRLIRGLLDQGVSVACDDTNLQQKTARDLVKLARFSGAHVRVSDLTEVDVELCVLRDWERGQKGERAVGEQVIREMNAKFLAGKNLPLPSPLAADPDPVVPYVAKPGTPRAVIVDLDGTLCLHNGRSPYDETRVGEDLPNPAVVEAVQAFSELGYVVLFCSGRTQGCEEQTRAWIGTHVDEMLGAGILLMRQEGDTRKDAIVKRELFDAHIRDAFDVVFILDDRNQVVEMWRELGLTVFQVAEGAF